MTHLGARIKAVKAEIESIERLLPYADGPAWSQDRDRIRELQRTLDHLERMKREGES